MLLPPFLHADVNASTAISSHPEIFIRHSSETSVDRGMEVMPTPNSRVMPLGDSEADSAIFWIRHCGILGTRARCSLKTSHAQPTASRDYSIAG
jgi:hypothetical protein